MSFLFWKIKWKHNGEFYCLTSPNSFRTENKLKEHENVCKNHDCCYVAMTKEQNILKHNHGENSMKMPFIIYADMESLLDKTDTCQKILKDHQRLK